MKALKEIMKSDKVQFRLVWLIISLLSICMAVVFFVGIKHLLGW